MAQVCDEYIDIDNANIQIRWVQKELWNGTQWIKTAHYRVPWIMSHDERTWLFKTFGPAGAYKLGMYWDSSHAGNYTIMDEQVYMMYQLKWSRNE